MIVDMGCRLVILTLFLLASILMRVDQHGMTVLVLHIADDPLGSPLSFTGPPSACAQAAAHEACDEDSGE
jgi:hypothetical protein